MYAFVNYCIGLGERLHKYDAVVCVMFGGEEDALHIIFATGIALIRY